MDILEKINNVLNEEEYFKLRTEFWKTPIENKSDEQEIGTIRTVPQNYWVATILQGNKLKFNSWEQEIKNIDKKYVENWFNQQLSNKGE